MSITYPEAIVVGLLQGVTELFPVSSLGHSVLIPALVGGGWARDLNVSAPESPYLAFIVGLHVATALALLIFYWRDWLRIVHGFYTSVRHRRVESADERLAWMIVIATIPVGLTGLLLEHTFRTVLGRPVPAAIFLMVNGAILYGAERLRRRAEKAPTIRAVVVSHERGSTVFASTFAQADAPAMADVSAADAPGPVVVPEAVLAHEAAASESVLAPESVLTTEAVDVTGASGATSSGVTVDVGSGDGGSDDGGSGDVGTVDVGSGDEEGGVASDRRIASRRLGQTTLVGSAQILALLPGISRSGATMAAGLFAGLSHEDAARFSFLLATPVILAAGVLKLPDLTGPLGRGIGGPVLAGSLASGIGAYLAVRFLTRWFKTRTLTPFAIYCGVAGLLSLLWLTLA